MVFAIKAILSGASQMVVLVFVPVWLFFSGKSLEVGNRFRLILYIGLAAYVANFAFLVLTPIILLYGLGVTSSITQIIVATLIYYIAVSYFPTPGASVGAELGAVALFAAFVPNGILGAFILIWRFFDHYVKMGAGGITALGEFVLGPARRRRRRRQADKDTSAKEGTQKP